MAGIVATLLCYCLGVWCMRIFLNAVICYQMNKNAIKKRKKGQSIKERLLYSRFREELPRLAVIWYFLLTPIHLLILAAHIILILVGVPNEVWRKMILVTFFFDGGWIVVLYFMFCRSYGFKFDPWIKKKRGMKK